MSASDHLNPEEFGQEVLRSVQQRGTGWHWSGSERVAQDFADPGSEHRKRTKRVHSKWTPEEAQAAANDPLSQLTGRPPPKPGDPRVQTTETSRSWRPAGYGVVLGGQVQGEDVMSGAEARAKDPEFAPAGWMPEAEIPLREEGSVRLTSMRVKTPRSRDWVDVPMEASSAPVSPGGKVRDFDEGRQVWRGVVWKDS